MSITIENTFTSDKQIYYPINYHLNKTSDQVYAEFKTTLPFLIFRHLTELTLAICFVFLLFLIIKAVKEIKRLHKLPPTNVNKMRNQMFLEKGFLWGLAMLTMIWILILWIILKESWAIQFLVKGVGGFVMLYLMRGTFGRMAKLYYKPYGEDKNE